MAFFSVDFTGMEKFVSTSYQFRCACDEELFMVSIFPAVFSAATSLTLLRTSPANLVIKKVCESHFSYFNPPSRHSTAPSF